MLKFVTRIVNDLLNGQYCVNKNIRFKTPMLRSNLCDYSDAYIVVKLTINLKIGPNNNMPQKHVEFNSNAPFKSCISKVNNTFIENAEMSRNDDYTTGNLLDYFYHQN